LLHERRDVPGCVVPSFTCATAALTAPHFVCPSTTISRAFRTATPYSIRAEVRVGKKVAGDPNGKDVAGNLIEDRFDRDARIGATQDDCKGILPAGELD